MSSDAHAAWQSKGKCQDFLLRLAVHEAESWVLADAAAVAKALAIPAGVVPRDPDDLVDAKGALIGLARRSPKRSVRREFVSDFDPFKPASGYVQAVCSVVKAHWRAADASDRSPSLRRAMQRIRALGAHPS